MGVYSDARFLTESVLVEAPEANLSYSVTDGANKIIVEMVQNDLKFFEAIITNDIQQAYVENAIKNGETALQEKLDMLQESVASNIWDKIVSFLKGLWAKVKGFFINIGKKIQSIFADNKKFVGIYKSKVNENKGNLGSMKYKYSKRTNSSYKVALVPEEAVIARENEEQLYKDIKGTINFNHSSIESINTKINSLKESLDDKDKFAKQVYSRFIGTYEGNINQAMHDYFFEKEQEMTGIDAQLIKYIEDHLSASNDTLKLNKEVTQKIDKWFSGKIKECNDIKNAWNKNKGERTVKIGNSVTSYDDGKGSDEKDKNVNVSVLVSRAASMLQRLYSAQQTCFITLANGTVAANMFDFKQMRRIYAKAASYSAKKEDAMLIDAVEEAADFEFDMLLNDFDNIEEPVTED